MTGNGKLCKIYLKKPFPQNVLAFIDLFLLISLYLLFHLLRFHVASLCLICTEEATTGVVLEHLANFTGKTTIKQKPTIIELIIHNTRHTKLCHLICVRSEWKLSNPWGDSPPFLIPPD